MTSSNALNIQDLYKTYTSGVEALRGINLCVKKGDFFALLGANGAGKSTTIGLISSLLKKTSGTIAINGHDLDRHPTLAKKSLGLVPQEINLNIFEKNVIRTKNITILISSSKHRNEIKEELLSYNKNIIFY